jgi:hypothetical protein
METLLIFVGIPVGVALVVAGLVYGGGSRRNKRYRPGRPFEFRPVWFLSVPEQLHGESHRPALPSASAQPVPGPLLAQPVPVPQGTTGGASDRW